MGYSDPLPRTPEGTSAVYGFDQQYDSGQRLDDSIDLHVTYVDGRPDWLNEYVRDGYLPHGHRTVFHATDVAGVYLGREDSVVLMNYLALNEMIEPENDYVNMVENHEYALRDDGRFVGSWRLDVEHYPDPNEHEHELYHFLFRLEGRFAHVNIPASAIDEPLSGLVLDEITVMDCQDTSCSMLVAAGSAHRVGPLRCVTELRTTEH